MRELIRKMRRRLFWKFHGLGVARRISWTTSIQLNGRRFKVPLLRGMGKNNVDMGDMWMIRFFEHLPRNSGGIFFDIGANVGQTLLKLRSCRTDLSWVGIEPNPLCVAYLEELIKANGFTDCTVVPIGLHTSNEIKVLEFYTGDGTDSCASLVENFRPEQPIFRRALVPALSYDALVSHVPSDEVAFVKIDVEGGEKEVVESILPILKDSRPPVLIEVLPVYSEANLQRLERQRAVEVLFKDCDYRIHRVVKDEVRGFSKLELLDTIGIQGEVDRSDYLMLPAETADEMVAHI